SLRRVTRARHPREGRNHGRSLPRTSDRQTEGGWTSESHGGHKWNRTSYPILPCDLRLSARTEEPIPGHRGVLGRARVRRAESDGRVAKWLSEQRYHRPNPRGPLPLP